MVFDLEQFFFYYILKLMKLEFQKYKMIQEDESMGLFKNNKKLCPICGNPTPRIFATDVEGEAICKECSRKIDLPDGMLKQMSMEEFRQYIDFYNQEVCRATAGI